MPTVMSRRDRRCAVVTGGGRGIGRAIARRFLSDGYEVVVGDTQLPAKPLEGVHFCEADVSDQGSVESLMSAALRLAGGVDVLVNNAGIWFRNEFDDIEPSEWDSVVAVNLRGPYLCTRAALPSMTEIGGGSIINIGSQAGVTVTRGQGAHYHATKAAVAHLTKALAVEFGPRNIRVNCVAPGAVQNDGNVAMPEQILRQIPLGRAGVPDDVADACAYLASDSARFVTGQVLVVNGGAVAFV
jgi:NAD(P)-dependent dehydrogenase (short-subunit alcohol dehydrogenase family)